MRDPACEVWIIIVPSNEYKYGSISQNALSLLAGAHFIVEVWL